LIAEDHSGWALITERAGAGGVGFDATCYTNFFHHLVGEQNASPGWAKLLLNAAASPTGPLQLGLFADALIESGNRKVVYKESHHEAGNDPNTARTIMAALGGAPLAVDTRRLAEARCRFACGMAILSAGTPMLLMGEEVGAQKAYTYEKFQENKEDLEGERQTTGAHLFRFYQDVIALRLSTAPLRTSNLEILHVNDDTRVIAFRRWDADGEFLVIGSLNECAFDQPSYRIAHPALLESMWTERLNSDAAMYGGAGVENPDRVPSRGGALELVIPANAVVVLERAAQP
jgi:1,4-alpha-glucan branching enzyme